MAIKYTYVRHSSGATGRIRGRFEPWGDYQQYEIFDELNNARLVGLARDIVQLDEAQVTEFKRKINTYELERENERIEQERRKRAKLESNHLAFLAKNCADAAAISGEGSIPAYGELKCVKCDSDISAAEYGYCQACQWPVCACGACRCGITSMRTNPWHIEGPWRSGLVLDWHTLESICIGEDDQGVPKFATRRSEVGELLYLLKYRQVFQVVDQLSAIAMTRLAGAIQKFDLLVPVPPSAPTRTTTQRLANALSSPLKAPVSFEALVKIRATEQLKTVHDEQQRAKILRGAFSADPKIMRGKQILIVDDLFRSGATLRAATEVCYSQGQARSVFVLALTRTRVHR